MDRTPTRIDVTAFVVGRANDDRVGANYFEGGRNYGVARDGLPSLLLILTESGAGVMRRAGEQTVVRAGEAALWLPGYPQDYATSPDAGHWRFRFAHARPLAHWARSLTWPEPVEGLRVVRFHDDAAWREAWTAMERAEDLATSPSPGSAELSLNAVEAAVLWCATQSPLLGRSDARVRAACDFARRHVHRRVTVDEMADAASVSPSRLTALFRETMKTSPSKYAETVRLEAAARLLVTTGLSGKVVADACGFHDAPHFSRRFAQHFGVPPLAYARGEGPVPQTATRPR